jgi:hypothetical protein
MSWATAYRRRARAGSCRAWGYLLLVSPSAYIRPGPCHDDDQLDKMKDSAGAPSTAIEPRFVTLTSRPTPVLLSYLLLTSVRASGTKAAGKEKQ